MAAAVFSIRGYAASMRDEAAVEGRRLLGIEDLPPLKAPRRCRWWADELASTVAAAAAAASPRRPQGKAKPPKKRSISDLFAAAPPLAVPSAGDTGCEEQTEEDGDEALCAIARRAKEEKKRKRKLHEEEEKEEEEEEEMQKKEKEKEKEKEEMEAAAAAAAAPESSGGPEPEGNFEARKEALENPNLLDGPDTHSCQKLEASQHHRKEREKASGRSKLGKINSTNKKPGTQKYNNNNKGDKVGKPRDLQNFIPRNGILKCTKHTSVKMVKETHVNSEGKEIIELCRKSVKRVKFTEADATLDLPERQSLCKMLSDAMASSSSSLSSSSSFTSTEGDKGITAESSSSHMPMEAFTKTKEANKNSDNEDSPEPGNREISAPLIDLNMALPETDDLDQVYDSYSELPILQHTHDETLNSDVQLLGGRENRMDFSSDSQTLERGQPSADLERRNSSSTGTFLHSEAIKVSNAEADSPPLSLTELAETRCDITNVSVKDTMTSGLPAHTLQDSFQQHQSWFSTNLNHGGSQFSTSRKFSSGPPRESIVSRSKESLSFRSELNMPRENGPSTGQTVRLMGKELSVCTARAESSSETSQKHTGSSTSDYLKANVFLPQQGRPFLSLQAQSFPSDTLNSTSTNHASTYHASSSQAQTTHNYRHPFPAANVFSGDRLPYENRFVDFSNPQTNHPFLVGCPPLPNHGSASFQQNSTARHYYSDPITRTEPSTAPVFPTTRQIGTPSSVRHANRPQQHVVYSASSSVCPRNSLGFTLNYPDQVVQEPPNSRRDAALLSRNSDNRMGSAILGNTIASSSGRNVQKRSGPVKLTPGAKHVLVPSDGTGDGDPVPVYSRVMFGSRSRNAAESQNNEA